MDSKQLTFLEAIELQTRKPIGNTNLVSYGIQNDNSDYRAHVGYKTQHVFVFPTKLAAQLLHRDSLPYILKSVRLSGIETAKGYPVPTSHFIGLQSILIPPDIYKKHTITPSMMTSTKGLVATEIVAKMLMRGLISLPLHITIIDDKALQIQGTDIIVNSQLRIQVKCDFSAGPRDMGGTGNLFLQVAECNPFKLV